MKTRTPVCDQCQIRVINNMTCHEQGCPNEYKPTKYARPVRERVASRAVQHARYLDCGPQNWDDR